MRSIITGIQQVGIGVPDLNQAWQWYRRNFGMNIPIFQDSAEATHMASYTGGAVHARKAVLAVNMLGGGGFEIWQYTSRVPEYPDFEIMPGDLGISSASLKTTDAQKLFELHKEAGINVTPEVRTSPGGEFTYFVRDPYGNTFQIVETREMFARTSHKCGGVGGVTIGVSDIDKAIRLYADILGYSRVLYDGTGTFEDLEGLPGGDQKFRRAKLAHATPGIGSFGQFFGTSTIELVSSLEREPKKIFGGRYWGDCGFIHVCFDIKHMDGLKSMCAERGFSFTVDSEDSFDMGEATGRFAYTEDPDGTLIELVETFKMPIIKKLRLYLDLTKRKPLKPLPNWMLKALKFSRVK